MCRNVLSVPDLTLSKAAAVFFFFFYNLVSPAVVVTAWLIKEVRRNMKGILNSINFLWLPAATVKGKANDWY